MYVRNWLNFLVIRHFSGSLQNAYLGEELKGFCIIKIQFLFSFRGGGYGPRWGLHPATPHHSEEIAATGCVQSENLPSSEFAHL